MSVSNFDESIIVNLTDVICDFHVEARVLRLRGGVIALPKDSTYCALAPIECAGSSAQVLKILNFHRS